MNGLMRWIPHFRTDYLAVFPAPDEVCDCGECLVATPIRPKEAHRYDQVIKLSALAFMGRGYFARIQRISR